jgi:YD repeat-containing protein
MLGLLPTRPSRADVIGSLYRITSVDPTSIDDAEDGYRAGSRWINALALTTWTCVASLGGDLGGTTSAGYVKTVRGVSGSLAYDGNGRLSVVTTALGTKTMTYNGDGSLASIAGTGQYRNKTFTYTNGALTAVAVS